MNRCKDCRFYKPSNTEDPFQEKYGLCMNSEITRWDQTDFFPKEDFGCVYFQTKEVSKEEVLSGVSTEELTSYLNERLKKMDQVLLILSKSQVKVLQ
jgi:uncharacterized Fe-S radical SAM superfamily protein PflX